MKNTLVRFLCENCDTELTGNYGEIGRCIYCHELQEVPYREAATLGECRHCSVATWVNNLSQCHSCEQQEKRETVNNEIVDMITDTDENTGTVNSWGLVFEDGSTKWFDSKEEAEEYWDNK